MHSASSTVEQHNSDMTLKTLKQFKVLQMFEKIKRIKWQKVVIVYKFPSLIDVK
jgi:hypothetical protein